MSNMIKVLFMVFITIAITITLTSISNVPNTTLNESLAVKQFSKRAGRLLLENKNPRSADHCNKNDEICYTVERKNSTCCNNIWLDLSQDKDNCGACNNKCKFTRSCCQGECLDLAYDKRNCGSCGNTCMSGGYCIYGVCNYA